MMYMTLPDGAPTSRLEKLLPHIINPEALSDEELTALGVARCEIVQPPLEWWQAYDAPVVDATVRPVTITYAAIDLDLAGVKSRAWERAKAERDTRQGGLMPYTYPDGSLHHNQMTEKVIRDLSGSTTAAIALSGMGVTDPSMPWTTHENVTHVLTPVQMVAFGLSALQWHSTLHMTSQTLRAAIEGAQSVAAAVAASAWPEA